MTRAMHAPSGRFRFGPEEAEALLRKKVRAARARVRDRVRAGVGV